MKAVIISIQPKWCELIAAGKKTVEVRKTKPKLETPFKVYIYCTKDKKGWFHFGKKARLDGTVIGEFVCNKITSTVTWRLRGETGKCAKRTELEEKFPALSCLTIDEIREYAGSNQRIVYGWHISDLVIYDEPKLLSEFEQPCKSIGEYEGETYCDCLNCDDAGDSDYGIIACDRKMKRPPQSWRYVEDLDDGHHI